MTDSKITIILAAQKTIKELGKALTAVEIYDYIVKNKLYQFNAKDPQAILKSSLRRHSRENKKAGEKSTLILKIVGGNKFDLL